MPNDKKTGSDKDKGGKLPESQAELDRLVEDRLKRERAKYSNYDELKTKADQFDKLQADGKGSDEKLDDKIAKLEQDLADERLARLKVEVAADKGLTPAQAKRLTGSSKEELESDADDLLEAFPAPTKEGDDEDKPARRAGGPPSRRPAADLKGGNNSAGDEEPDEKDPAKLAEAVPRI